MPNFTGQLRTNEIYGALFNMIISQQVFADNIKGTYSSLVDKARVDGSLYGDTKLYFATDVLHSEPWGADEEALNLLQLHRADSPETQAIVLDVFRQISLTLDKYLSKRAWSTEGAFSSFNSVMLGWIRDTKRVYDATTYNTFLGNEIASGEGQNIEIDLTGVEADASLNTKEKSERRAQLIAERIANLLVDMKDVGRGYNDYGFLRSYEDEEIKIIWNSKYVNEIRKVDLPTIFHKEALVDKFNEEILPARYFGKGIEVAEESATTDAELRSGVEQSIADEHYFAGDVIPTGTTLGVGAKTYTEDADVICKVFVKLPPIMSAFEVGTSFFNPKSLTENHYLTWGHNTLEHLKNYPCITIKEKAVVAEVANNSKGAKK